MKRLSSDQKRLCTLIAIALCFAAFLLWHLLAPTRSDAIAAPLWDAAVLRTLASIVIALLLWYLEVPVFSLTRSQEALTAPRKRWCVWMPALLVCINNAPILGLISQRAQIDRPDLLWLWGWACLGIACFEEFAFRGLLFRLWLQKRGKTRLWESVILCNAVFALTHLVNLAQGASFAATALQVGYSFLIGAMCTIVLLATGSIWHCVLLHAVYDFGGGLIPYLGHGKIWDGATVTLTAILGVSVAAWLTYFLWDQSKKQ